MIWVISLNKGAMNTMLHVTIICNLILGTRLDVHSLDGTVEMELWQFGPSIRSGMSTSPWWLCQLDCVTSSKTV